MGCIATKIDRVSMHGAGASAAQAIEICEVDTERKSRRLLEARPAVLVRHLLAPYRQDSIARAMMPQQAMNLPAGATVVEDLRNGVDLVMNRPFHAVDVIIPWSVFDVIAVQAQAAPIDMLETFSGEDLADPTIEHLIGAMLAPLGDGFFASKQYIGHLKLALATHLAHAYGRPRTHERLARGGLAPHVMRRAQEILQENLQSGLTLEALADACGLSTRHFARAFQESAGMTPHRWMTSARIAAAKAMMRQSALSLAEIADLCGFADQSHLTRVFKREEGVPPASWRRDHRHTASAGRVRERALEVGLGLANGPLLGAVGSN